MSACDAIPVKIGETLQLDLWFSNDDGSPLSLMDYSVFSQVRDLSGDLVDVLGVTWFSDCPNKAMVSQGTSLWPAGVLLCDVQLIELGSQVITYSDSFSLSASAPISMAGA